MPVNSLIEAVLMRLIYTVTFKSVLADKNLRLVFVPLNFAGELVSNAHVVFIQFSIGLIHTTVIQGSVFCLLFLLSLLNLR